MKKSVALIENRDVSGKLFKVFKAVGLNISALMKCDLVPLVNISEVPLPRGHKKEDVLTVGQSDHQDESLINYFHYGVAGTADDRGWGCGYRTLQTIASHINRR